MPFAVRVTDVSNHGGTVVGPGVSTVLIGGMPAAVNTFFQAERSGRRR